MIGERSIILVVMIVFEITPSWRIVCIIPYWFMCILLTSIGITQILSIIGCRYRDFTQIVANLMQVMFFITPVMFSAKMISGRALLIKINPFYYYIEILRGGLLNEPVEVGVFIICGLISVCVFASGYLFFAKYRNRIVYWL